MAFHKTTRKPSLSRAVAAFCEALEVRRLLSTVYVDAISPGPTHDGSSWTNAYPSLQTALGEAVSGETIEVAQGTYMPTSGTDQTATFQLIDGVSILGGYAGYGTANPDARNVTSYPTILSGDIGVIGNNSDNSYNVVTAGNVNTTAVLDGFTITGGNGEDGEGGGILIGGSPTINNCTISNNSAITSGGGVYSSGGSPVLTNCIFSGNIASGYAGSGGGMYDASGSPILNNCLFSGNSALAILGEGPDGGGGIFNYRSSPTLTNCIFLRNTAVIGGGIRSFSSPVTLISCSFLGNTATDIGGGLVADQSDAAFTTLTNCIFSGNSAPGVNSASGQGGAVAMLGGSRATVTDCTFSGNSANMSGGAICVSSSGITLTNCILWGDVAATFSELYVVSGAAIVTYSDILGWPGVGNISANPLFMLNPNPGPDGTWGTSDDDYGNLQLQPCSPAVDAGTNAAVPTGVTLDINGNPRFQDVPTSAHSGAGTIPIVDMGAYETTAALSASAGGPYYVSQRQGLTLNGAGSSNIAGTLSYSWNFNDAGVLSDATGASPTFSTAGYPVGTQITATLMVTDAASNSVLSTTTITILPVLYVDQNATGANDGASWADAYTTLTAAMSVVVAGQTIEVAQGTYYPTSGTNRNLSFQLENGVAVYGGFAGDTTTTPGLRNIAAYPSILSGNIGNPATNTDNSNHVVTATCVDATAILNGFTITAGYTIGNGAGLITQESSPTVANCIFTGNTGASNGVGGAVDNFYSGGNFINCLFYGNTTAGFGGAILNNNSSPVLINCTFSGDTATDGGSEIYNTDSSVTLVNCIVWESSVPAGEEILSNPNYTTGTVTVAYSDIQGGYAGPGNINTDPLFVNPAAGNFALQANSPCVNAGSNAAIQATGATTDLAGNPRIVGLTVDMGAYEVQPTAVVWTGSGDATNWNNPANWSDDLVPTLMNAATIPRGATVQLGSGTFAVASLTLQGNATLNLGSGTLEIDFGDAPDPLATIQSYIQNAYANGAWSGTGITSSIAQSNQGSYAIGYADGNDDVGTRAVAGQIYMQTALAGDANLDGVVNFPDLLVVAQNYGKTGQDWADGDFNYDGIVNFPDLLLVAQNYGKSLDPEALDGQLAAEQAVESPGSSDAPTPSAATSSTPALTPSSDGLPSVVSPPSLPTPTDTIAAPNSPVVPTVAVLTGDPSIPAMPRALMPSPSVLTKIVVASIAPHVGSESVASAAVATSDPNYLAADKVKVRPPRTRLFAAATLTLPTDGITDDAVVGVWSDVTSEDNLLSFRKRRLN